MEIMTYVEAYGFPIVVTCYLLYERSRFNQKMLEALNEISVTLKNVNELVVRRL